MSAAIIFPNSISEKPDPIAGGTAWSAGLAGELESARQVIEERFVTAGDVLARIVDGVGALVAVLETFSNSLSQQLVSHTRADLEAAASSLAALPQRSQMRQTSLSTLRNCHQAFSSHVVDLASGLRYLKCLALTIKMTAGGIAEAQEEFGPFVKDIEDNIKTAQGELAAIEAGLCSLWSQLSVADNGRSTLGMELSSTVATAAEAIVKGANVAASHQVEIRELAETATQLARQIRKEVSRVLGALQIGDITRQRIEHIQSALRQIDAAPGSFDASDNAALRLLMAAQLQSCGQEFRREVSEIYRSMATLGGGAKKLLTLRDQAQDSTKDGAFHQLQHRLSEARGLAEQIEAAESLAEGTGGRAAEAADRLTVHLSAIQGIKAEVNLMALNAGIKCSRLGDHGRSLNVLAVELGVHGRVIDDVAARMLAVLAQFNDAAQVLCADGTDDQRGSATTTISSAAQRIDAAGQQTQADLVNFGEQGRALVDAMQQSVTKLGFEAEIASIIDAVAKSCDGEVMTGPIAVSSLGGKAQDVICALMASYTMSSEREIHAAIMASSTEQVPGEDRGDSDLLF